MFSPLRPIYPVAGIREIEDKLIPNARPPLMERAGRAAAQDAVRLIMDRPGPILIACGPGNNGGDGFVMARQLAQAGREVVVAFCSAAERLPAEAAKAHADYLAAGGSIVSDLPAAPANGWALVVDALFGIGLGRPIEDRYASWIHTLNAQPCPRMALDVPSGLDADTGSPLGATFRATHTTTFIALKPGLLTNDGPDHCGEISVQRIEIDAPAWLPASTAWCTCRISAGTSRAKPRCATTRRARRSRPSCSPSTWTASASAWASSSSTSIRSPASRRSTTAAPSSAARSGETTRAVPRSSSTPT